ncbi:hypothetical protein H6F98_05630 [Microcoleus sp. FACHB-SPT15]|uniref:hypothetical protein n=1 Tax=Microcoleus sp. FACHB-SPT15 TaxID=2692830 RepID=UPI00177A9546|nr:hypothetical protein [Microcoleus sp. FACHB-SPT15]MBD1804931.1 hypothetical protein [Microcoleus sp. FACHB-SPT15]
MATTQSSTNRFFSQWFQSNTAYTSLLVIIFLMFGIIGILNHEMWRDELQSWMIARDSSSFINLFQNLRYEGHPGLWHIFLYVFTRFTHNPIAMQLFHLIIASGLVYVFVHYSPFTRLQKLLFIFGYFPFYEYSLISRNYSLGVLLIFLFCTFFPLRQKSYILLAVILVLLANTNIYAWIIAVCLALTLVFERLITRIVYKTSSWALTTKKLDLIFSVSILLFGLAIALFQMLPPADANFKGDEKVITQTVVVPVAKKRVIQSFVTLWRSYLPIPDIFNYHFWDTNLPMDVLMEGSEPLKLVALLLTLGLLGLSIALFIQKPVVLFLYLSSTFGILLFTYEKYQGHIRHHGHLFIVFLACLWISEYYSKSDFLSKPINRLVHSFSQYQYQYLNLILCIHVFAGIFAFSMDFNYPFSASKEATKFLQQQDLNNTLIVGSTDYAVSPITGYLGGKIYYPESDRFGSFINWNERTSLENQEILEKISKLITQENKNILLVLSHELDVARPELEISKLSTTRTSIANETYRFYLIQRKPVVN